MNTYTILSIVFDGVVLVVGITTTVFPCLEILESEGTNRNRLMNETEICKMNKSTNMTDESLIMECESNTSLMLSSSNYILVAFVVTIIAVIVDVIVFVLNFVQLLLVYKELKKLRKKTVFLKMALSGCSCGLSFVTTLLLAVPAFGKYKVIFQDNFYVQISMMVFNFPAFAVSYIDYHKSKSTPKPTPGKRPDISLPFLEVYYNPADSCIRGWRWVQPINVDALTNNPNLPGVVYYNVPMERLPQPPNLTLSPTGDLEFSSSTNTNSITTLHM